MTRADHVVALGGGVVGDLAGFCAATYQRGHPGRAGADHARRRRSTAPTAARPASTCRRPRTTSAPTTSPPACSSTRATLDTLPAAELRAGYAEVLKTALIAGGTLWERIAADEPIDERVIFDCVRCKLAIVAADEHDDGRRQVLNLGHTVGHAIETVTGYARYRHGEAVGLGLLAALELSGQARAARAGRRAARRATGCRRAPRASTPAAVIDASRRDKKRARRERAVRARRRARARCATAPRSTPRELEAAVAELCR